MDISDLANEIISLLQDIHDAHDTESDHFKFTAALTAALVKLYKERGLEREVYDQMSDKIWELVESGDDRILN